TLTIQSIATPLSIGGSAGTLTSTAGTTLRAASGALSLNRNLSVAGPVTLQANGAGGQIPISNGRQIAGDAAVTVLTSTLSNNGSLSAGTLLTIQSGPTLNISGTGTLSGANSPGNGIRLISTAGAVSASQQSFTGSVRGSSVSDYTVNATSGVLLLGDIAAPGALLFTNNSSNIVIAASRTVDSTGPGGSLTITPGSGTSVTLNAGATARADTVTVNTGMVTNSGQILSRAGTLTITNPAALNIINSGTIGATGNLTLSSNVAGLTVAGAGQLSGTTGVSLTSTNSSVNVDQGSIVGTINGSAGTFFTVATSALGLTARNVSASNGNLFVSANGGTLTLVDTAVVSASHTVQLSSATGTTVGTPGGTGVTVSAGALNIGVNGLSTDLQDYDLSEIASPGTARLLSTAGPVTVGDNVSITSRGGNIGIRAGGNVTFGTSDSLFAQGGNIWINAVGAIRIPAGSNTTFTAVARELPAVANSNYSAAGSLSIANNTVKDFMGGGISMYVATPSLDHDDELRTLHLARLATGVMDVRSGVTNINNQMTNQDGGTIKLITTGSGKIGAVNTRFQARGGVISIDPPGDAVDINDAQFFAFGPRLVVIALPAGGGSISSGSSGSTTSIEVSPPDTLATITAQRVPSDTTKQSGKDVTTTQPYTGSLTCAPAAIASPVGGNSKDGNAWVVVSSACQPFSFEGDDESVIVGSGGTSFSPGSERTILLKEGKIVAVAGKKDLVIETAQGKITIPAGSATIVEQKASGSVRVANLSGEETNVTLSQGGKTEMLTASAGEELMVADQALADEELIPVDGIEREPIGGVIAVAGHKVQKQKFDQKEMADREALLVCNMGCFTITMRKKFEMLKSNLSDARALAPQPVLPPLNLKNVKPISKPAEPSGRQLDQSMLQPIGFMQPATGSIGAQIGLRTLATKSVVIKQTAEARIVVEKPNTITLKHGEIFVTASQPVVVKSAGHNVYVKPGAMALVSNENGMLKLRNIWEGAANSVHVQIGSKFVSASVGQELIVGTNDHSLGKLLKGDAIGRRRIRSFDVPGGHTLTRSEVSLVSLAQSSHLLSRVLKSPNEGDRAIANKLLKMAACLSLITAGHGAYSTVQP
ncbi:MAG: hypothetical protein HY711_08215, partial [Candidatus Melainabacteria bacterium]|nr:hypothetical protein [Candidatus Melainabacteria bacterium]